MKTKTVKDFAAGEYTASVGVLSQDLCAWELSSSDYKTKSDNNEVPKGMAWPDDDGFFGEGYLDTAGLFGGYDGVVTEVVSGSQIANTNYKPASGTYYMPKYKIELNLIHSDDFVSQYGYSKFKQETPPQNGFKLYSLKPAESGKLVWKMTVPIGKKFSIRVQPFDKNVTALPSSNAFDDSSLNIVLTGDGTEHTYTSKELNGGDTIWIKSLVGNYTDFVDITFGPTVTLVSGE